MDILDQSEIDSLLSGGGDSEPSVADAGAGPIARSATVDATLPDDYRLRTTEQQLKRLLPVQVPVVVRLAERRARINEILNWTVGTIVEFEKHSDADLDLVVSNVAVGVGNAVKCGEKFGLRVSRVQPWTQRLISMGLKR